MWVIKHGFAITNKVDAFYTLYWGIRGRCERKSQAEYKNYWGRGIKCLWRTFEEFKNDMYESYLEHVKIYWRENTQIDRLDNNWHYCKENCKRATRQEQINNKCNTLYTIIDGVKYTSQTISKLCWICIDGAGDRIKNYNAGKLTKEWLLYKGKMPKHSQFNCKTYAIVDGIKYTTYDIINKCWITKTAAYQRIKNYNKGKIKENVLFKS